MASQKRKGVGAGVTALMGAVGSKPTTQAPEARKTEAPKSEAAQTETAPTRTPGPSASRENGKPAVRKLTVDVPESVHDDYEDLYLELRRTYRRLKRVQYAPLVIRFGLDRQKIEQALGV